MMMKVVAQWAIGYGASRKRNIAMKNPLAGRTVLVTRTTEGNALESKKLRDLGASVVEIASIRVEPPSSWRKLDSALERLNDFDWIIFTSANGAKYFLERCSQKGKIDGLRKGDRKQKFACVGPGTKRSVEERGFTVEFLPKEFLTSSLGVELAHFSNLSGSKILLPRAERASQEIVSILEKAGAQVEEVLAYRTMTNEESRLPEDSLSKITDVTLTSPSTVEALAHAIDLKKLSSLHIKVHCIGPVTAKKAAELGLNIASIAKTHSIDGMLVEMVKH